MFVGATLLTLGIFAAYLGITGTGDENIRLALRAGGRLSFVLLLVVFVARPLRQLRQTSATRWLMQNRALIGVSFAGAHTAHLILIGYRLQAVPDLQLTPAGSWQGILIYAVIYAMLITTFRIPRRAIGPKGWRILHKVGLYGLMYAFIESQLPTSFDNLATMNWWLVILVLAALGIRVAAFIAARSKRGLPAR